jgi:hypothetical protein
MSYNKLKDTYSSKILYENYSFASLIPSNPVIVQVILLQKSSTDASVNGLSIVFSDKTYTTITPDLASINNVYIENNQLTIIGQPSSATKPNYAIYDPTTSVISYKKINLTGELVDSGKFDTSQFTLFDIKGITVSGEKIRVICGYDALTKKFVLLNIKKGISTSVAFTTINTDTNKNIGARKFLSYIGQVGMLFLHGYGTNTFVSYDGLNWLELKLSSVNSISYGYSSSIDKNIFIMARNGGQRVNDKLLWSSDGINWNKYEASSGNPNRMIWYAANKVINVDGLWIASGSNGGNCYDPDSPSPCPETYQTTAKPFSLCYSKDGISWTKANVYDHAYDSIKKQKTNEEIQLTSIKVINEISYNDNLKQFVAVQGANNIYTSSDGEKWVNQEQKFSDYFGGTIPSNMTNFIFDLKATSSSPSSSDIKYSYSCPSPNQFIMIPGGTYTKDDLSKCAPCSYGEWTKWSQCDGIVPSQSRTRRSSSFFCPSDASYTNETTPCPASNCILSPSGKEWGACDATQCGTTGKQQRQKYKLDLAPMYGGTCPSQFEMEYTPCSATPCAVNCTLSPSEALFSPCSATQCGTEGKQQRQKYKVDSPSMYGGSCPSQFEMEYTPCSADPCPAPSIYVTPSTPSYVTPSMPFYVTPSTPSYVTPSTPSYVTPTPSISTESKNKMWYLVGFIVLLLVIGAAFFMMKKKKD